jgi:DNA-directed RNA polymerase specialized sigma24 family protein
MARIEWVRQRLDNWARWCSQQDGSGLGYPKQSSFLRNDGGGSSGGAVVPINSLDASETDDGVKALQGRQSHLYLVLTLHYAQGLPRHLVAKRMGRTERTVINNLDSADVALARWFEDRQAARKLAGAK